MMDYNDAGAPSIVSVTGSAKSNSIGCDRCAREGACRLEGDGRDACARYVYVNRELSADAGPGRALKAFRTRRRSA